MSSLGKTKPNLLTKDLVLVYLSLSNFSSGVSWRGHPDGLVHLGGLGSKTGDREEED